ncbi:MAG: metal ABC transporter ATP-binding protein [Ignavibacteriaceae bacterium]
MSEEMINLSDVSIGYGKKIIVKDINFSVNKTDFIGLVGPNGAGKTTLLKTLLGTLKPLSGNIRKKNLRVGYVPQRDFIQPLLPYSVYDVVMMSRYSLIGHFKNPGKLDKAIVEESLIKVGIEDLKNIHYYNLSGGQRQRALIAKALAFQPNILILDEPTNGMDTPSHYSLLNLITNLHQEKNLAIIMVSHLLTDVANYVKKLILIDNGFFQFGDIDEILSEENLKKAYSSEFAVKKTNGEYLITPGKGN